MIYQVLDGLLDDVDEVDDIHAAHDLSSVCEDFLLGKSHGCLVWLSLMILQLNTMMIYLFIFIFILKYRY